MSVVTMLKFAETIGQIQKTDRWILLACDGEQGEGKSCFTSQLAKVTAVLNGTTFSYNDNMTFLRTELKTWLDGDEERKGQKPEYSVILADELISMFFKRNWYDFTQIDGIELLNKCRDRHLLVLGNIPNFWDLDSAIYPLISFWVHIHERGVAWVFQKDRNPFTQDKWHKRENEKIFARDKNPSRCKGYLFTILFDDWQPDEKEAYYNVRNEKRKNTEGQRKQEGLERYQKPKEERDRLLRWVAVNHPNLKIEDLQKITVTLSETQIIDALANTRLRPLAVSRPRKDKRVSS